MVIAVYNWVSRLCKMEDMPGNLGAADGFLLNDLLPILLIIFMAMFLLRDRGSRGGSPMMTPGGAAGGC